MSVPARKILILGGYGVFGGRLARLLAREPRLQLVIAGRSLEKARAFCASLPEGAEKSAVVFDRDGDLSAQLSALRPDLVVDASGPFQTYSGDVYALAGAAIALGADYMDLSDSSEFSAGIGILGEAARGRGVYVLSGVSSFPALTAAVVRHLTPGFQRVEAIRAGIAPSPFADIGANVVRAIASYAGQPVTLTRNGAVARGYGLTETMRRAVRPPGMAPLQRRLFALVDVPDLRLLPPLWPHLRTIWIGAAPAPQILHYGLIALAWMVRLRMLPSLAPFAAMFHAALSSLRWGAHRGGMLVEIEGADADGAPARRSWHMLAEGDDGPLIPAMAVAAIVRRELAGERPAAAARACLNELELSDYTEMFQPYRIRWGVRDEAALVGAPLYRRMLASAYDELPPSLRAMHDVSLSRTAHGEAAIERGAGLWASLVAALFGFPEAAAAAPVSVRFDLRDGVETWTRIFAGKTMRSRQWQGAGRWEGLLCESFGPFTFGLALERGEGKLRLSVRRWAFLGLPLPLLLAPRGDAFEEEQDGRFRFDVAIALPLVGPIVRYRGWLLPE